MTAVTLTTWLTAKPFVSRHVSAVCQPQWCQAARGRLTRVTHTLNHQLSNATRLWKNISLALTVQLTHTLAHLVSW